MTTIPTLQTERLTLRGPSAADFADSAAMWGDPAIIRYIGGKPFTPEDVWGRLLRYIGHWELLGYGPWIVRDKQGTFIGEVGLFDLHRDITPTLELPEAGWVLTHAAHGKGYATEAMRAVLAWGREHFGDLHASCIIDPGNAPSLRVAEKLGFVERTRTTYHGDPTVVLSLVGTR